MKGSQKLRRLSCGVSFTIFARNIISLSNTSDCCLTLHSVHVVYHIENNMLVVCEQAAICDFPVFVFVQAALAVLVVFVTGRSFSNDVEGPEMGSIAGEMALCSNASDGVGVVSSTNRLSSDLITSSSSK